jgi:methyl-accepting chemotaxis protein
MEQDKSIDLFRVDTDLINRMHEVGKYIEGLEHTICEAFWLEWSVEPIVKKTWGHDDYAKIIHDSSIFITNKYNNAHDMQWLTQYDERGAQVNRLGIQFVSFMKASVACQLVTLDILRKKIRNDPKKLAELTDTVLKCAALETDRMNTAYSAQAQKNTVAKQAKLATDYAEDIATDIEQSAGKSRELKNSSAIACQSARGMMAKTSEVATAAEQSAMAMREAAHTAGALINVINDTRDEVDGATEIANLAIHHARTAVSVSETLSQQAGAIESILGLIREIAGQTNLLALNATIEAARAGDAGRGFAVVAQEVKSLANQTSNATDDIGAKIAAIQAATAKAVEATMAIRATVEDVHSSATRIRTAMDRQSNSVTAITAAVDETALAADMMSSTIMSISGDTQAITHEITNLADGFVDVEAMLTKVSERGHHFAQRLTA